MKKWMKYGFAAAVLSSAALMLCSCKALDDLKWDHAVYTEMNAINSIEFRGKTYELIDENIFHDKTKREYSLILDGAEMGRVTNPDVPVLLSVENGEPLYFNKGIEDAPLYFAMDYSIHADNARTRFYCIKEEIPTFEKMINEAKMDHFYLMGETWYEEDGSFLLGKKLLDDASTGAIFRTLNRPFDRKKDYESWRQIENLSPKYLHPNTCDANQLFTDNQSVQIVRTKGDHHTYYIGQPTDPSAAWYDENGAFLDARWKRVSDKDAKKIEPLFSDDYEVDMFYFETDEEEY